MDKWFDRITRTFAERGNLGVIEDDPFPELSCEQLREKIRELSDKKIGCDCLTMHEIEELNRLQRSIEGRERAGQC